MKYLITESQFAKTIYMYLDMLNLHVVETRDGYEFYNSRETMDREYPVIAYFKKYSECFVGSDFAMNICSIFSMDPEYCLSVISNWVGDKLDVEIERFISDFGAD